MLLEWPQRSRGANEGLTKAAYQTGTYGRSKGL